MKKRPLISIVIPVKPGGYVKALEAVKKLDYPPECFEVIIAEGTQPSKQRNKAAERASGKILYFLDDDSLPASSNLKLLAAHYEDVAVAGVGGPSITPGTDSFLQRCFGVLLCSPFGGGGIRNRYRRTGISRESSESELILCNLSFRADIYKKMGGLNEELYPNEENELMSRIQSAGLKLIHDPDIYVMRSQRKGLKTFLVQMISYGRGRMEQTIISPKSVNLMHFIPAIFIAYLASLPLFLSTIYMIPLFCYIFLSMAFALKTSVAPEEDSAGRFKVIVTLFLMFPIMHIGYGAGTLYGLKKLFGKSRKKTLGRVNIINMDIQQKGEK